MKDRRLPMSTFHGPLTAAVFVSSIALLMLPTAFAAADKSGPSVNSAYEKLSDKPVNGIYPYRMRVNGLTVLIQEQHLAPVVAVMMVYGIGSRNEAVGYTGATHFLEHLMFKGTQKHDPMKGTGIDDTLKPVGGINNASTSQDRTNYYEVAPVEQTSLLLDLEADRMRNLLLREDDRKSEMMVVRNELERGEDDPDELLMNNLYAMAFREHPYHHPVIGWRKDVENVPTERLRQFYHDFYWPENATLIVIGDIQKEKTLAEIAAKFGQIKKGRKKLPRVYTQEPPQEGERRFTVVRGQDVPRLLMGFHTVEATNKDTYPLEVLQSILGDRGKTSSRLYRALVDNGLAVDAFAFNNVMRDPGLFIVGATPSKETTLEQLEKTARNVIEEIADREPTDAEVRRAKLEIIKRYKLDAVDSLGRADQIGDAVGVADWKWWASYADNISKVTAKQVQAAAKKYLTSTNMTVGYYKPKRDEFAAQDKTDAAADRPANTCAHSLIGLPLVAQATAGNANQETAQKENPLKLVARTKGTGNLGGRTETLKFDNGLTVIVLPMVGTATVTVAGKIKAGRYFTASKHSKVAPLTAQLLTKGSSRYSKFKISEILEEMGTGLEFSADSFFAGFNVDVVASDAKEIVPLIADVMQNPLFKAEEFEKSRQQLVSQIQERKANTGAVAWMSLRHALYKPESVHYANTFEDQLEHLKGVTREDLAAFHKRQFTPANTVLSFVGDITTNEVIGLIAKEFASYRGSKADSISIDESCVNTTSAGRSIVSNIDDKTNMDVVIGRPVSVSIKSKDYFAETIGSAALGYDSFACRLAPLRDRFGLTYSIASTLTEASFPNSIWAISYSVAPENLEKAQGHINRIVKEYLKSGITKEELDHEKGHLTGTYVVESRSPRTIASQLAYASIMGLTLDFLDNFARKIKAETQASVNESVRKYFQLDKCVTSVAGQVKPVKHSKIAPPAIAEP